MPSSEEEPARPPTAPPYLFARNEIQCLLHAITEITSKRFPCKIPEPSFQTLILILYGTGLRISEALNLKLKDVDMEERTLTVRDSKFFKSRLVPFGESAAAILERYLVKRLQYPLPTGADSALLAYQDGTPLIYVTVQANFRELLNRAGIQNTDAGRRNPCLTSFRHTFATERITEWYRVGADVQRLLPVLSTYLGHASLNGTQVYLSMTPQLLQQASLRFNQFVNGDDHE